MAGAMRTDRWLLALLVAAGCGKSPSALPPVDGSGLDSAAVSSDAAIMGEVAPSDRGAADRPASDRPLVDAPIADLASVDRSATIDVAMADSGADQAQPASDCARTPPTVGTPCTAGPGDPVCSYFECPGRGAWEVRCQNGRWTLYRERPCSMAVACGPRLTCAANEMCVMVQPPGGGAIPAPMYQCLPSPCGSAATEIHACFCPSVCPMGFCTAWSAQVSCYLPSNGGCTRTDAGLICPP
jgi:hypothetical protein